MAAASCKGCTHRGKTNSISSCDYILNTGKPRGCAPGKGCIHYEKAKRKSRRKAPEWRNKADSLELVAS